MSHDTRDLPSALDQVDEIVRRGEKTSPALFLDYDGTLTPIVERPELARVSAVVQQTVRELADLCPVAVVSGRGLADVRALLDLPELIYAGSHGFEIEGPPASGIHHREGQAHLPAVEAAEAELERALGAVTGALVERKALSVAVHYRLVQAEDVPRVERIVEQVIGRQPQLHRTSGKCVIELQPALDWHKGKAVLWLIETLEAREGRLLPLYIGDDVTDENAFASLPARGVGIVVTDEARQTAASYRLDNPPQVQQFLQAFLSRLRAR